MSSYKTPGVYVEEISTLPPSVAEVATAIPAFLGYTEKGKSAATEVAAAAALTAAAKTAKTAADLATATAKTKADAVTAAAPADKAAAQTAADAASAAAAIAVAAADLAQAKADTANAIADAAIDAAVEVAQVSTMLEFELRFGLAKPTEYAVGVDDAISPAGPSQPEWLLWYALNHYFKNGGGRCYVISIGNYDDTLDVSAFENGLMVLEREDEPTLTVIPEAVLLAAPDYDAINQASLALCSKLADRFAILDVREGDVAAFRTGVGINNLAYGAAYHPYLNTALTHRYVEGDVEVSVAGVNGNPVTKTTLDQLASTDTARYNKIKKALANQRVVLPPSGAIAGIYAQTDGRRGVWHAPANVGVASAIGPVEQITTEEQEALNVDPTSGKSINAIRTFPGKGTLVWGARTLAGNDNEWRYVPVRRLFITIEESAKKASAFAVFEPNDASTWLKIKGMLESYLYGLWEQGALQGSAPKAAYYVNIGLGKTMSTQDILEGRMIVEIGVAAVRPAEFVILRFSHKLAEA